MLTRVNTEQVKAIITDNDILEIELWKIWCFVILVANWDNVTCVVFDFQFELFELCQVWKIKDLWWFVQGDE